MGSSQLQRSSGRGALVLVLGLALLTIGVAVWIGTRGGGDEATPGAASGSARQESELRALRDAPPEAAERLSADSSAEAAASAEPAPKVLASAGPQLVVRVVERASGAPVPGAEVLWLRYERDDAELASRARGVARIDALLEERGERAVADARGAVRIPRDARELAIVGRAPGLWGRDAWPGDAPGELRLELDRDAHVDVEVVDHLGRPAPGVPVGLVAGGSSQGPQTVRTDARGRARLPHANHRRTSGRGREGGLFVRVAALLERPLQAELDLEALPREPVRLVLPPTGALEVLVHTPEGRSAGSGHVQAHTELPPPLPDLSEARDHAVVAFAALQDGRARFEHVSPGLDLLLLVTPEGHSFWTVQRCRGPERAGELHSVEVVVGADQPIVRARAVDELGEPLADAELRAGIVDSATQYRNTRGVRTDAHGFFQLDLRDQLRANDRPRVLYVAQAAGPSSPPREGERGVASHYAPGLHDVGDVVLAPAPALAAGTVVGPDGGPIARAVVAVELFGSEDWWGPATSYGEVGADGARWRRTSLECRTGTDGRFAVHGAVPPARIALTATHPGLVPARAPCERGATDVRLQLTATATLVGRIVSDGGAPLEKVLLEARLESDGPGLQQRSQPAAPTFARGVARPDGSFAVPDLSAGRWTLSARVHDRTRFDPLLEVEGIEVRAGEACTDPRLDPLDLRGIARSVRIEVVAPEAGAVLRGRGAWREVGRTDVGWTFDARESFELLLLGAPLDVSLAYEGYRPVQLDGVAEDRTVELEAGLPVLLRLPAGLRLPELPSRLVAQVSYPDLWGKTGSPGTRLPFDARGELRLRAGGPGRTLVEVVVESTPGRSVGSALVGTDWREVQLAESAGEQLVELDVTQAEIDAALAKIAAR